MRLPDVDRPRSGLDSGTLIITPFPVPNHSLPQISSLHYDNQYFMSSVNLFTIEKQVITHLFNSVHSWSCPLISKKNLIMVLRPFCKVVVNNYYSAGVYIISIFLFSPPPSFFYFHPQI